MPLTFHPLSPANFDDFASMHARSECQGCFCMYWHFPGDNRAWQMSPPDANRDAKRELLERDATHGLMAYRDDTVVGTIQFEPRDALIKLTSRMPYRGLDPDPASWAVTCVRVLESARKQGVARELLRASVEYLRDERHARVIDAFPRRGEDLRDDEVWTGPEAMFIAAGFRVVRDHVQYPVYRWEK